MPDDAEAASASRGLSPPLLALAIAFAIVAIVLVATGVGASAPERRLDGSEGRSARSSSILMANKTRAACDSARTKCIRIVHHNDNESDLFWKDVHAGFDDAQKLVGAKIDVFGGVHGMRQAILDAPAQCDGLLVTCPYVEGTDGYKQIDSAIKEVIKQGLAVITFNTDTYHNIEVLMYIGSQNRIIGTRGARLYMEKERNKARTNGGESGAHGERVSSVPRIRTIVALYQERFNVTLDWRAEGFHEELEVQHAGENIALKKAYDEAEASAQIQGDGAGVLVLALGVMRIDMAIALRSKFPAVTVCQVGDTGRHISELCGKEDISFVGQQPYQQGYSCIMAMYNVIHNYANGRIWLQERGNSANSIDATYECTEDCASHIADTTHDVRADERAPGVASWLQIGFAVMLTRIDIATFDRYGRDPRKREEAENEVQLADGSTTSVPLIDATRNYARFYDGLIDEKKVRDGNLTAYMRYLPLYERKKDATRNLYEYYVVQSNGTRVPLSQRKGVRKIRDGDFVRMPVTQITYRVTLYDQDELTNMQSILKGSLGNECQPCA